MTVDWIDAPGTVLAGKSDAIDFTTDLGVVAISVGFGAERAEERAFRDGVWLYPYLGSSGPLGGTAGAYSLVRSGGWPAPPSVYVDELVSGGGGEPMPTWSEILHVDFRGRPPEWGDGSANWTLDDLVWWRFSGANTSHWTLDDDGLSIQSDNSVAVSWGSCPALCLRFDQIPGFDPTADHALICSMNPATENTGFWSSGGSVGMMWWKGAKPTGSSIAIAESRSARVRSLSDASFVVDAFAGISNNAVPTSAVATQASKALAMLHAGGRFHVLEADSPELPTSLSQMRHLLSSDGAGGYGLSTLPVWFGLTLGKVTNNAATKVWFHELRILQRGAADPADPLPEFPGGGGSG